jgi:hypothetical protein
MPTSPTNAQAALQAAALFAAGEHAAKVNVLDVLTIAEEFLQWLERQERIRHEHIKVG